MTHSSPARPLAIVASSAPPRTTPSTYPEPFFSGMAKREKRPLGDLFGLKNFGVNLTRLSPGGESALLHRHSKQDEFIYVVEGEPTLVTETEEVRLSPGMCAGFPAQGIAHHLVNRTDRDVAGEPDPGSGGPELPPPPPGVVGRPPRAAGPCDAKAAEARCAAE